MAEFLIPSVVFEVASNIPAIGLTTIPKKPWPVPLTQPIQPSFLIPLAGFTTIPLNYNKINV